jgi:WXG100 family type VII secretion target
VSEFSVNIDDLDQLVARLSGLVGFIEDHLDEIDDKVATLTGTGWEGVAAQAYSDAHRQWVTGAREFTDGVRNMSDAAGRARTRYSTAADINKQMLQSG